MNLKYFHVRGNFNRRCMLDVILKLIWWNTLKKMNHLSDIKTLFNFYANKLYLSPCIKNRMYKCPKLLNNNQSIFPLCDMIKESTKTHCLMQEVTTLSNIFTYGPFRWWYVEPVDFNCDGFVVCPKP